MEGSSKKVGREGDKRRQGSRESVLLRVPSVLSLPTCRLELPAPEAAAWSDLHFSG